MKKRKDNTRSILRKIYKLRRLPTDPKFDILHFFYNEKFIDKSWYYLEKDFKGKDLHDYKSCKKILENLSYNFYLTKNFIRKYADVLNWNCLCHWQNLSEKFIEENKDKVNWGAILEEQCLSENWLRKNAYWFKHEHWYHISMNEKIHLSESFLREYKDQLEWCFFSAKYAFTKEFLREMKDEVYYRHFYYNKNIRLKKEEEKEFKKINLELDKDRVNTWDFKLKEVMND